MNDQSLIRWSPLSISLCLVSTLLLSSLVTNTRESYAERPVVLELGQVQVSETKPNGKRWDFGLGSISKPDLVLKVYLGQEELITTKKCKDAFSCVFKRSVPLLVSGSQDLSVTIIDRDLKRDDVIDQLTITLDESELHQAREVKLAGKSTTLLTFKIRPLITPKSSAGDASASETAPQPTENPTPAP